MQYCHVGTTAKQCRFGLLQDSDFAGDLEDSKYTSGGTLCIFGSHTFVPISWMWKKQTSVSHSSTESEIFSLDAGLRLDGISALNLWGLIVTVLHGNTNQSKLVRGNLSTSPTRKSIPGKFDDLNNVDFVSSNANSSRHQSTRKRLESTLPRNYDDHIAEEGFNSLIHYNLVDKSSNAPSDENSGCEGCSEND